MMDIRTVSEEEKRGYIDRVNESFDDIRKSLSTLSVDMESDDLIVQSSSVWIGGQLCNWWSEFIGQIRTIDQKQKTLLDLQDEIKEASNDPSQSIN